MSIGLRPYSAMKDSGVDWLGEVPTHWEVRRNGRLFSQRNETGYPDLPILEVSLRTGVRVRDFANSTRKQVMSERDKYKRAAKGDIAYNMMRMWQGAVGVAPEHGLISPAYVVARPFPGSNSSYFERLFRTPAYMQEVDNYSRGIVKDRNRLYWEDFKRIPTCYPPPEEQAAIVRYLDHVDRRVRRLVRAKRKLIALLTEQKQAVIHRAVTRGLDADVPLKDSGVAWLGEVPEHWEVVPFKRRVGFQEGPGIMAADFQAAGVPLLRISCLSGPRATLDGCNYLDPEKVAARWAHFAVKEGDYLLSASGSTGGVSLATAEVEGAIPYTGIIRLWSARSNVYMPYVTLFMSSRLFQNQIDIAKSGVGIEHFGPTHLKEMLIVLPPYRDQRALVERSIREQVPLDLAISRANREIDLLSEYRTRLTADVVTGKLDVREAAAALPEVDPLAADDEPDTLDAGSEPDLDELDAIPEEAEA